MFNKTVLDIATYQRVKSGKQSLLIGFTDDMPFPDSYRLRPHSIVELKNPANSNNSFLLLVKSVFYFRTFYELYTTLSPEKYGYKKLTSKDIPQGRELDEFINDSLSGDIMGIEFDLTPPTLRFLKDKDISDRTILQASDLLYPEEKWGFDNSAQQTSILSAINYLQHIGVPTGTIENMILFDIHIFTSGEKAVRAKIEEALSLGMSIEEIITKLNTAPEFYECLWKDNLLN